MPHEGAGRDPCPLRQGCVARQIFLCAPTRGHLRIPSTRLCHRVHYPCYSFQPTLAQIITVFYSAHMVR